MGSRRRRLSRWGTAAGVSLLVGSVLLAPTAARADEPAYQAFAKATSFHATLANQSIPVGLVLEGLGPEADATQGSLGGGVANAAFPYFGDSIPGAPGIAGAALGLPTPPYPLIASATSGSDPASVAYPGIQLDAEAGTSSTVGQATAGNGASGLLTTARVDAADDGSVIARAISEGRALSLGGGITLSGVRSEARVQADALTGKLTRMSTSSIGRINVPGLSLALPQSAPGGGQTITAPDLGVTDGKFTVTVPGQVGPQSYPIDAEQVIAAFAAQGVTMTFQQPQETATGIISGAYTFAYTIPAPPPNQTYNGPTPVTFDTGNTIASVDLRPVPPDAFVVPPGSIPASSGPTAGVLPSTLDGVAAPGSVPLGTSVGGVAQVAPTVNAFTPRTAAAGLFNPGTNIFSAFVIAGLCALAVATALRLIGVRSLWAR